MYTNTTVVVTKQNKTKQKTKNGNMLQGQKEADIAGNPNRNKKNCTQVIEITVHQGQVKTARTRPDDQQLKQVTKKEEKIPKML